jgi:hypothetical protein
VTRDLFSNDVHNRPRSKVLHLTVDEEFFGRIVSGVAKEVKKEVNAFWNKRLFDKSYDYVYLNTGYIKKSKRALVKIGRVQIGFCKKSMALGEAKRFYKIELGEMLFKTNAAFCAI